MITDFNYTDQPTKDELEGTSVLSSRFIDKDLSCRRIKNGIVLSYEYGELAGEVLDANGKLALGTNANVSYSAGIEKVASISEDDIKDSDETVLYLGGIYTCWGHYITDGLSKAWFLLTDEFPGLLKANVKVVFVSSWSSVEVCPKPWKELLDILLLGGAKIDFIPINECTRFREILIPDNSLFMHEEKRTFTREYRHAIDTIIQNVSDKYNFDKYKKIYLSRSKWIDKNRDFGEKAIEKVFEKNGYTILHPECFSVAEQIYIYSHAESVVATSGSIAHNILFCRPQTEVIILRKTFSTPDYQTLCNEVADVNVTYIDAHLSVFVAASQPDLGPFYLYINDNLKRFVRDKFGKDIKSTFSVNQFLEYSRICMKKDDVLDRFSNNPLPPFYFEKMREELQNLKTFKRRIYDLAESLGVSRFMRQLYYRITR